MMRLPASKIRWWIRLQLQFKRSLYSRDQGPWADVTIRFKVLRGVMYILETWQVPPLHPNCRCVMILPEQK